MGWRLDHIQRMYHTIGANIFVLSYRGYGDSEGVPSEKGLMIDAQVWLYHIYVNNI